jgi:hypothetical protein
MQGDQIGRIFGHFWVIAYFGASFLKSLKQPTFIGCFFPFISLCIIFDINGLGYILGDFSQAHPVTLVLCYNRRLGLMLTFVTLHTLQAIP